MNICIFGADGRTGVEVVRVAQERGHHVTAFVYDKSKSHYLPKNIRIVEGNVLDSDGVQKALVDVDAVISVLGHIKNSDPLMQTKGIENIVEAMNMRGIRRVISLTGTGARVPGDLPSFIDRILNFFVAHIDPDRVKDGIAHVKVLQASSLDWTVLRVLKLGSSPKEPRAYKLTDHGPAELITSRKKVARIMVDILTENQYIRKLPVVSG